MMDKQFTSIEQKMQSDYDTISEAFSISRKDKHWPEIDAMVARLTSGAKVLDLGCGSGRVCTQLKDKQVEYVGLDISAKQIEFSKNSCPGHRFIQGSILALPFEDHSFDFVFMIACLPHLISKEQRLKALQEAHRVLKPGGQIIVNGMNFWQIKFLPLFFKKKQGLETLNPELRRHIKWNDVFWPWRWKTEKKIYRYYHAFRKSELKSLLERVGFFCEEGGNISGRTSRKNIYVIGKKMVK